MTIQTTDPTTAINLAALYNLQAILIEIQKNLLLINSGSNGQILIVTQANLFQLAVQYYGDALQWTTIAEANNLYDPIVNSQSPIALIIPAATSASNGVVMV